MTRLWQQICFYVSVLIAIAYSLAPAETLQLKLCDQQPKNTRSLVFVNTLDGKITALDGKDGKLQWISNFNHGPMLSSNIHNEEINDNEQSARFIPSLNGNLYKFDGKTLETVPITVDQLLYSPFHFSNDLVFSGGKELRTRSVSINTGELIYECGFSTACNNNTDHSEYVEQDTLVIKRFQQTVRAAEVRTGNERWNFSVGQYNLELIAPADILCSAKVTLDIEIKVVVPEGLIYVVNKSRPTVKLWQYKFDSPIVAIWREDAAKLYSESSNKYILEPIDLFDSSQWIWGPHFEKSPNLYLGIYEKQLYVQENHKNLLDLNYVQHAKYPWRPYPAIINAVVNILLDKDNNDEVSIIETNEAQNAIALSVLYNSEYINSNGFYLYSTNQLIDHEQCNQCSNSNILLITGIEKPMLTYTENEESIPQIIVSLWWKEILLISFTTAILCNYILTQRWDAREAEDAVRPPVIVERPIEIKTNDTTNDDGENVNNFKSRYLTDFDPVDCLGKGGYGVVFEAKNKIDDCNYAIKRIALSNWQDSRDRVMREVKALAKLDHHNIVRYFNAWLECPPNGWQEEHDQQWIDKQRCSAEFLSEITQTETKPSDSVCIDVSQTDQSSIENACEALELNNVDANDDSYITFERSDEKQYDNSININNFSTDTSDLSSSSNATEKELPNVNESDCSESIVFEETDNININIVAAKKNRKRQKSFSLDLRKKPNTQKLPKTFLYIQMQLCQRFSLREWLKQHTTRDSFRVLNIFQQIVDAVEYVHLQGLIHRDLKPSNIFFAFDDKIKIGDFGLVTAMTEGCDRAHTPAAENENVSLKNNIHTACVGTHLYMSPEQMNGQIYNYKVDIYSLGIIFFELLTPFFTDMERIVALSNLKKSIFPKDFAENSPAEYNLLKMMLDEDPTKRPTTLGIKAKPPLQNYEMVDFNIDKDSKWHFELPQLTRHSSVTSSSSSGELLENIN